jgi:hypothetical protein
LSLESFGSLESSSDPVAQPSTTAEFIHVMMETGMPLGNVPYRTWE